MSKQNVEFIVVESEVTLRPTWLSRSKKRKIFTVLSYPYILEKIKNKNDSAAIVNYAIMYAESRLSQQFECVGPVNSTVVESDDDIIYYQFIYAK